MFLQSSVQKAAFVQQANKTTCESSSDVITLSYPLLFFLLLPECLYEELITEVNSLFTPTCQKIYFFVT